MMSGGHKFAKSSNQTRSVHMRRAGNRPTDITEPEKVRVPEVIPQKRVNIQVNLADENKNEGKPESKKLEILFGRAQVEAMIRRMETEPFPDRVPVAFMSGECDRNG